MYGFTFGSPYEELDWTQVRRIAWKDHRRISGLAYALFAFWVIGAVGWTVAVVNEQWSIPAIVLAIVATCVVYALGWAGITFASEHDDKTYPYLLTLPVTGKTVFYGKLYYGVISTLLLMSALGVLACLQRLWVTVFRGSFAASSNASVTEALVYSAVFALALLPLAMATGMFWSMRIKRPLIALTVAGFCLGVLPTIAIMLAQGLNETKPIADDLPNIWVCVSIILAFTCVFMVLARTYASTWLPITSTPLFHAGSLVEKSETSESGKQRFRRLFWLHNRQSLATNIGVGGLAIALAAIPMEFTKTLSLVAIGILGVLAFQTEHFENRYRLLAQLGAKPGNYWLSRLFVPLLLVFVAAMLFTIHSGRNNHMTLSTTTILIFGCIATFAFGQFFSAVCKSAVIACSLTLFASLVGWGFLMYCDTLLLPVAFAGLIALLPLLASYLRIPRWFRDNESWKSWIVPAMPMIVLFLGLPLAAIAYRVYEIPSVELPRELVAVDDVNTQDSLRQAVKLGLCFESNALRDAPQDIGEDPEIVNLANKELNLDEISAVIQSLQGSKANFSFYNSYGRKLSSRFIDEATRSMGDKDANVAWDRFKSALDIASLMNNGNSGFQGAKVAREIESLVYGRLPHWAKLENNDVDQIRAAAEYINDRRSQQATWQQAMAGTYAIGETYPANSKLVPPNNSFLRDYDVLMPWENVRAARFRNYNYGLEYDYHTNRNDETSQARQSGIELVSWLNHRVAPIHVSNDEVDAFDTIEIQRRKVVYLLVAIAYHKENGEYPTNFEEITLNGSSLPYEFNLPGKFMDISDLSLASIQSGSKRLWGWQRSAGVPKYAPAEISLPQLFAPGSPSRVASGSTASDFQVNAINSARQGLMNQDLFGDSVTSVPARSMTVRKAAYRETLEQLTDGSELARVKQLLTNGTDSQRTKLIEQMSEYDPHWVADVLPELTELLDSASPKTAGFVAEALTKAIAVPYESLVKTSKAKTLQSEDIREYTARTYAVGQPENPNVPVKNPENGHYYELVVLANPIPAEDLPKLAANRRFRDMTGHLVTITSKEENDFLKAAFERDSADTSRPEFAWTSGVFDSETETWIWSDGPEQGEVFWPAKDGTFGDWLPYFEKGKHLIWLLSESPKKWLINNDPSANAVLIEYGGDPIAEPMSETEVTTSEVDEKELNEPSPEVELEEDSELD